MSANGPVNFSEIYRHFSAPISKFDCGSKCAPYNEHGVPFCCDTRHAIPTVYKEEWIFLQENTDLWHLWRASQAEEIARLRSETPNDQILVECLGHQYCRREFRSITCRSFPFFPYMTQSGKFIGLTYYWEYEDRCWVINNLEFVDPEYRHQFIITFDQLLAQYPDEQINFHYQSSMMRRVFGRRKRTIPLLHRNGNVYKVSPRNGRLRKINSADLPKFGPYDIAARFPFPDEVSE